MLRVALLIALLSIHAFAATRFMYRSYVQYPTGMGETLIHQMFPDSIDLDWRALVDRALATDSLKRDHPFWRQLQDVLEDRSAVDVHCYTFGPHLLRYDLPGDTLSYLINISQHSVDILNHSLRQYVPVDEIEVEGRTETANSRLQLVKSDEVELLGSYTCAVRYILFDGDTVEKVLDDLNSPYRKEGAQLLSLMRETPILGVFQPQYLSIVSQLSFPVRTEIFSPKFRIVTELVDVRDVQEDSLLTIPAGYTPADEREILPYLQSLQKGQP